jgi:hypothetical protein
MDFGEAWSQQTGDDKKIKEKYASGFEIKDGRAVATGDKKNPFADRKEFATEEFGTKEYGDKGKAFSKKQFEGKKGFETKDYATGAPARETGKRSFLEREDAGINDEFATTEWAQAARGFDTGQSAAEQGRRFNLPGNKKRLAPIAAGADRVQIDTNNATPVAQGGGGATTLSVDDVRKMLSPESFR